MHFEDSYTIERPPGEVFAFMTEPENLVKWQTVHTYCTPLDDGPPRLGYRVKEGAKIGPRRWDQVVEFSEFEPGRVFAVKVIDGPPSSGRWTMEPDGSGTRLHFEVEAKVAPLLVPLLKPLARRQWRKIHANLRREVLAPAGG